MRLSESKSPGEWKEYCEQQEALRASRKRAADELTRKNQKKPRKDPKQEIIDSLTIDPDGISL